MAGISQKQYDRIYKHIEVTNHELGSCQMDIAKIKTDMVWLKYIATATLTAVIGLGIKAVTGL